MRDELNINVSGEAGQGLQTIGLALCRIFKASGLYLFADQDVMSRIRGGNNFFRIRASVRPVGAPRSRADVLMALDGKSVELHRKTLSGGGIIVVDREAYKITENSPSFHDLPMNKIAKELGNAIYESAVACGFISGLSGIEFSVVQKVLQGMFGGKDKEIVESNIKAARAGYDSAAKAPNAASFKLAKSSNGSTLLMAGVEAAAAAAIKAGCKFYSAYPMSPSTGIMNTIAAYSHQYGIAVEQAEDEIAAVNMAIGASFAGARSMTSTSGGGFALMVEGLSLAGMTETPVVIVDAQRPAPATGFPTRTEQADLDFVIHAGHGEFARAVFAPGTIEQTFHAVLKAFDIADKYQVPAIILLDQTICDSYSIFKEFDLGGIKVESHVISKEESVKVRGYKRYALTGSGISPRAVPSWIEDPIYVDSDEHTEEGHITEDADIRVKMVEKRLYKKMAGMMKEVMGPASYNIDKASTVILCFGSTLSAVDEAVKLADGSIGYVHLPQVWPFPAEKVAALLGKAKKILTVENNAAAQLAGLLRRETGIKADGSVLKFDGRPFNVDELTERIK